MVSLYVSGYKKHNAANAVERIIVSILFTQNKFGYFLAMSFHPLKLFHMEQFIVYYIIPRFQRVVNIAQISTGIFYKYLMGENAKRY